MIQERKRQLRMKTEKNGQERQRKTKNWDKKSINMESNFELSWIGNKLSKRDNF